MLQKSECIALVFGEFKRRRLYVQSVDKGLDTQSQSLASASSVSVEGEEEGQGHGKNQSILQTKLRKVVVLIGKLGLYKHRVITCLIG